MPPWFGVKLHRHYRIRFSSTDEVRFRGEYEWNEQGGVLHWTHDDPKDWHADGWLIHSGMRYE